MHFRTPATVGVENATRLATEQQRLRDDEEEDPRLYAEQQRLDTEKLQRRDVELARLDAEQTQECDVEDAHFVAEEQRQCEEELVHLVAEEQRQRDEDAARLDAEELEPAFDASNSFFISKAACKFISLRPNLLLLLFSNHTHTLLLFHSY